MLQRTRVLVFWAGVIAMAVLSAVQFHAFVEERIVFRPRYLADDYRFDFPGQPFTEHLLTTPEGDRLSVLVFAPADTAPRRGVLLYCHGNADHLQRWGREARPFTELGYTVVIWDYRGFGKSRGWMNQQRLLADAERVYDFALGYGSADSLVLYGRSLGSGLATWLAAKRGCRRLGLETPYTNLHDMTRQWVPFLPAWWPLKYQLDQDQWLLAVRAPVLITHGTADEVVPHAMGAQLAEALRARGRDVTFVSIAGGRHKDLPDYPQWQAAMRNFLR